MSKTQAEGSSFLVAIRGSFLGALIGATFGAVVGYAWDQVTGLPPDCSHRTLGVSWECLSILPGVSMVRLGLAVLGGSWVGATIGCHRSLDTSGHVRPTLTSVLFFFFVPAEAAGALWLANEYLMEELLELGIFASVAVALALVIVFSAVISRTVALAFPVES